MPRKTLKNDSPRPRIRTPRKTPIPLTCTGVANSSIFDTYSQNDTANKARWNSA